MNAQPLQIFALALSKNGSRFIRCFHGAGPSADGLIALACCGSLVLYARLNKARDDGLGRGCIGRGNGWKVVEMWLSPTRIQLIQ